MRITFTRELPCESRDALAPFYAEVRILEKERPLNREELKNAVSSSEVLVCTLMDKIDKELLAAPSPLKLLLTYTVGVDHIDLSELKKRGILLSHTPGALTAATAELTWGLILAGARNLIPAFNFLNDGKFIGIAPKLFLGKELRGSTLGIFGMGRIGMAVAEIGLAFGMKIIYTNRSNKQLSWADPVCFESLLAESDVLSVHCPLTAETKGLFDRIAFEKMKPDAMFINTARGVIHHEKALTEHLINHPEFTAGLDVFEKEPQVAKALTGLANALCVPHIGSATHKARGAMANICLGEAIRFAKGEKLQYGYPL